MTHVHLGNGFYGALSRIADALAEANNDPGARMVSDSLDGVAAAINRLAAAVEGRETDA